MPEPIRKYFDVGPAAIASTSVYSGGATGWSAGIAGANTSTSITTAWVTGLSQSDDQTGRIGQSIAVETLDIRVKITPDNSVVGHGHLRMVVYADEELDGAAPDPTNEIFGPKATSVPTGLCMSFLQPGYFGRFKIIEDKHFQWYNSSTQNSFQQQEYRELFHESHHDLKSHRVMWDNTNLSAIANARKGHIFINFYYENCETTTGGIITLTTTNPPGIQLATRIRYRDE